MNQFVRIAAMMIAGIAAHALAQTAAPISGQLLGIDGAPLANTKIALSSDGLPETIPLEMPADMSPVCTTDSTGHFSFPAPAQRAEVVAFTRAGYVVADAKTSPMTLKLTPWAKLKVAATLNGKPAPAGIAVRASYPGGIPYATAVTDDAGHAEFDHLLGETYKLTRGRGDVSTTSVVVRPGETKSIELAITGRPVRGRMVLPPGAPPNRGQAMAVFLAPTELAQYALPGDFLKRSAADRERWYDAWEASSPQSRRIAAQREASEAQGVRFVPVANDLSFELTCVEPGTTWFQTYFDSKQTISAAYRIDMPAAEGASLDRLDVGDVQPHPTETLSAGQAVPDISFRTADGRDHLLSEFRGKVVFIDFWGVWCAFCKQDMPNVKAIRDAHANDADFVMISLSVDDEPPVWEKYTRDNGMTWTQGILGAREHAWPAKAMGVLHYPAYYVIGRDGKLVANGMQSATLAPFIAKALTK